MTNSTCLLDCLFACFVAAHPDAWCNVGVLHVVLSAIPAEPAADAAAADSDAAVLTIATPAAVNSAANPAAIFSVAKANGCAPALVHLQCVTQVTKTGICGDFVRVTFNPLTIA